MKIVHEMRMRRAFEQQKSSGPLPIILGVVIAFGIGLLGVSGVVKMSLFTAGSTVAAAMPGGANDGKAEVVIPASSSRTGRAETAPLIKTCIPLQRLGIPREMGIEPGDIYRLLWAASSMSRVAAVAGIQQKAVDDVEFAAIWADVADCIYRQNGWVLCDPDNRALAVEAANTFLRQLSAAAKAEQAGCERPDEDHAPGREPRICAAECAIGQGPRHGWPAPSGFRRPRDRIGFRHVRAGRTAAGRA